MRKLRITVNGKAYEVLVEDLTEPAGQSARPASSPSTSAPAASAASSAAPSNPAPSRPSLPIDTGAVTSPMAGVVKSVLVSVGDEVKQQDPLIVLEAMKMENQITAPAAGKVKSVDVEEGESVQEGHVLVVLE
jgi:biotin carboxyl carrier protein